MNQTLDKLCQLGSRLHANSTSLWMSIVILTPLMSNLTVTAKRGLAEGFDRALPSHSYQLGLTSGPIWTLALDWNKTFFSGKETRSWFIESPVAWTFVPAIALNQFDVQFVLPMMEQMPWWQQVTEDNKSGMPGH